MATYFSNIKERVLQIPEFKGISKEKFFEEIGVSYGNFKGKAKEKALSSETLATIVAKYSDINTEWLLTGNGPIFKPDNYFINEPDTKYGNEWKDRCIELQEEVMALQKKIIQMQDEQNAIKSISAELGQEDYIKLIAAKMRESALGNLNIEEMKGLRKEIKQLIKDIPE